MSELGPGDLVKHEDYPHWGLGIVISFGPTWPISGESVNVMWPDVHDKHLLGLIDSFPIASLIKI